VLNALAALAALKSVGIPVSAAAPTLTGFHGVARRFQHIGESARGAAIYDDYAHHPTEVRAALTTARQTAGDGRVIAIFQPHLFSRTASLAREFGLALAIADVVIVTSIYPARELPEDFPGITGWVVATATADAAPGKQVYYEPSFDDAELLLDRVLRQGDLAITIGAGDIFQVGRKLVAP
jgi:UDP-N-acetylmuramate--alanine ligase